MERFSCKTKILSGMGAAAVLGELGCKRLLIVTDPFFEKNGTANRIAAASHAEQTRIYSGVLPDPTVELAAKGALAVKEFAPDTVAALGGGSAMDCAKAMAYFAGGKIRLVAIPTTSGSGSEVTDFAILTHNGVKHPLVDEALRPDVAILDGELLKELPAGLIADSGFDVLSHALEAYVALDAGAVTDALAQVSFCTALHHLGASFAGDLSVRLKLHNASAMAGLAFTQAGLGLCHGLSHALGGAFHIPHGRLNGILLPAVVSVNAQAAGKKYAALARAAGLPGSADTLAVRSLKNRLIELRRELRLPATLAEAGVSPSTVEKQTCALTQAALADPCCKTNPVPVTGTLVQALLREVSGRG